MINVAILPADPSTTCLSIRHFLATLSPALLTRLNIQPFPTSTTTALLWLPNIAQGNTAPLLRAHLVTCPALKLVQLPMTGVEDFLPLMGAFPQVVWCCAKGCYSSLVAEHTLAVTLSMLRGLHAVRGGECVTLTNKKVLILGRGSIANEICILLQPFNCNVSYVDSKSTADQLYTAVGQAEVIFVTCPLTPATHDLFNTPLFRALQPNALLVNVARGQVVNTSALIDSLSANPGQRAALDVIYYSRNEEKEQMEKLVREGRVLITNHAAIPSKLIPELLGERLRWNLQVLVDKEEGRGVEEGWKGRVDADKGY
ncbi:uncharacterized protein SPSC_04485 [Sporisorium scitamineum]|uniref:D-isomer specific 2-hydroxyacid dehydrogenase NAD-binding domain-containing protein n=1 Tax=Sporisorium scitamineum TaxID=49012 RepID=A0A127ZFB5_9BASI|nr:uncharacterized protein SPSC_04485 [Sporisorium scitamineum]